MTSTTVAKRAPAVTPQLLARCRVPAGAALAVASLLPAQAPSAWSTRALPNGFVQSDLFASRMVLSYRDQSQGLLHTYSPFTGTWVTTSSAASSLLLGDDYVGVVDAAGVRALSAWTGRFEALPGVTAFPTHVLPTTVVVRVSGTAHVFSSMTGSWHSAAVPAGWSIVGGRRVLVAHPPMQTNPLQAMAFDVHTGNWHTLSPQPYTLSAVGVVGSSVILGSSNYLFGFSSMRPTWVGTAVNPLSYNQVNSNDGDYCLLNGLLYSGLTGTFLPSPAGSSFAVSIQGNLAQATGQWPADTNWAAGAGQNTWVQTQGGGTPAFSPLRNSYQLHPGGAGATQFGNTAVTAAPGPAWAYSAYTGQWHAGPTTVAFSRLGNNSVLLPTASGVVGFAAPSASFVTNPTPAQLLSGFVAVGGGKLLAFDAHGARWLEHPYTPAAGAQPTLGTRVVIATDATRALGFGVRGRRLEARQLAGAASAVGVRDDYGYVIEGNQIHVFSGLADTTTWQDAPDGSYGVALGTRADIQVRTPAGHIVLFGFGPPAAAPIALPPFGELWIDPAALTTQLFVASPTSTTHREVVSLVIPSVPALRGTRWLQQAFTIPPAGSPYLGEPSTLFVQ